MKITSITFIFVLVLTFAVSAQTKPTPQAKPTPAATPAPTPEPKKTIEFTEAQSAEVGRLQLEAANAQLVARNTQLEIQAATATFEKQQKAAEDKRGAWLAAIQKASGLSQQELTAYEIIETDGKLSLRLREKQ